LNQKNVAKRAMSELGKKPATSMTISNLANNLWNEAKLEVVCIPAESQGGLLRGP